MEEGDEIRGPRGIQSIEVGGQLLRALAHHGRPMALKDLAREAGMPPAKAHPYLVSFGKLGLIEQEPGSGRYGLGPLALQLGLISLQQYDPVRLATPLIEELALQTGHTVSIAVWGNRGPTIVRVAEAPIPVHVTMRHGTVMSVRGTASGWLFAAYHDAGAVMPLMDGERDAAFEAQLGEVRRHRMARAIELTLPGISALAAPVFDGTGAMVLSITAIGPSATFDASWDGPLAQALQRTADQLSRRLGWQPARPQ
ncbi:IclR family transcriptional regulator [Aquincola sp. MAHUQ-54]|uniref:IclR family transcriptional regulator n=1 Tax=Aquincola agrisoli TaxID=3119538 RepID=A0AAW9QEJ5_9BURK